MTSIGNVELARQIAAEYQSPGTTGSALAALASGAEGCSIEDMLSDVKRTRAQMPEDRSMRLLYLEKFLTDVVEVPVYIVWSSYDHTFVGSGEQGYEDCLTCGARFALVHDDPDSPGHGEYQTESGDQPSTCTRLTNLYHGDPEPHVLDNCERFDETGDCEHVAVTTHHCNCVICN